MVKKYDEDVVLQEFKKTTETGYEKITPVNDKWTTSVQVAFAISKARVMIPEAELVETEPDEFEGEIKVKKAFGRTYFEKAGAGFTSVKGDYYTPEIIIPVTLKINDLGEEIITKRPTGEVDISYVDSVIDATSYIDEHYLTGLTEEEKYGLSKIDTGEARQIWLKNRLSPAITPFALAIDYLGSHFDLFKSIVTKKYIDVHTDGWENADIELSLGTDVFLIKAYSIVCKGEYGFMVSFDFKDEILAKVKLDGYLKEG